MPPSYSSPPASPRRSSLSTGLVLAASAAALVAAGVLGTCYFYADLQAVSKEQAPDLRALLSGSDRDAALTALEKLLTKSPAESGLLIEKSLLLSQKGIISFKESEYGAQAEVVARAAIASAPTSSEAYRALGFSQEVQGKYADAHESYQKAISMNPNNLYALTGEARVYELEGDVAKAVVGYGKVLGQNPHFFSAELGQGRLAARAGDIDTAIDLFASVYSYSPNLREKAYAAYAAGMLYARKNDFNQARGYQEKSRALDEAYQVSRLGLGIAAYGQAVASTTAASSRAGLLKYSARTLETAAAALPNADSHPFLKLDLGLLLGVDTSAALKAAAAAVSSNASMKTTDQEALTDRINALAAQIASVTRNP